jgi:hypothetical protein
MRQQIVVIATKDGSVEMLTRLLRGSPFAVQMPVTTAPSDHARPVGAPGAGGAHDARELLNLVDMLTRCLQLPDITEAEWRQWPAEIADANRQLETLYAGGLSRDFLGVPTRSRRPRRGGIA